jgi:peptidoglycan hydrolase-like protein with peptidoglycan-binding domain
LLQAGLKQLGVPLPHSTLSKGVPDGIFGNETVAALKRFQEAHKLKADGIAGKDTIWLQ